MIESILNEANRVLILMNPHAGAKDSRPRVERLAELLHRRGFVPEIFTDLQAVTGKAAELHAKGELRALVGVGGDGTAAELVNRTPEGLPLTLLPGGNENLLARHLGLDPQPEKLAETIAGGKILRLDAGRAGERIFLLMAGCGLDAEVVRLVHRRRTGHIRSRDYLKPLWEVVRTYDYPELRVYCDETPDAGPPVELSEYSKVTCGAGVPPAQAAETAAPQKQGIAIGQPLTLSWLAAFNLPCYGGGLKIAPHADCGDAQLDMCGFRGASWTRFLTLATAVYLGRHRRLGDWMERKISRLRIESDAPVPYQLDGDPGGLLPLEIEVLPQRMTLIVP
jgi:diacylglycerol kinase (ATP)